MRIGIYGGTFNPVHNGHIHLAEEFLSRLPLDRVLIMPVQSPPHKDSQGIAPAADRLAMCGLAVRGINGLAVSDVEVRRPGPSYTADTLGILSREMPGDKLFFLMGADMFLTLEQWRNFSAIARLAALCACSRHEGETARLRKYAARLKALYGAECHIENIPVVEDSSTAIRERLAAGRDVSGLVPLPVLEYIRKNGLYGVR